MKKLKKKKDDLLNKLFTTKDGKKIKLGKDVKIIGVVVIAVLAFILFGFFNRNILSKTGQVKADANTSVLDLILLKNETKETSNIDTQTDKDTSKLVEYKLNRVIDGDTIEVEAKATGNSKPITVRLLSINTPESVNPNADLNNEWGNMASEYVKNLLNGTEVVYLSFDAQETDEYGRSLAYVWLSKDANPTSEDDIKSYMLNSIIIQNGYAECKIYEPNHKYGEILTKQEEQARSENKGLWADAGYRELTGKKN